MLTLLLILSPIGYYISFLWYWKFLRSLEGNRKIVTRTKWRKRCYFSDNWEFRHGFYPADEIEVDSKATKLANQKESK